MKKLIEDIEQQIETYRAVSKTNPTDEWLKGFVCGLISARKDVIDYFKINMEE